MRRERARAGWLALTTIAGTGLLTAWMAPVAHARDQVTRGQAIANATIEAQGIAQAEARGLDYVPGEVIFKFKKNTPQVMQTRALSAIRSHPQLSQVRWSHDVGTLRDVTQPDARVLAQQLGEQAEIEFAQPNYLRHTQVVRRAVGGPVGEPTETSVSAAVRSAVAAIAPTATAFTPNDPFYSAYQWNMPLIGMPGAWAINPGGSSSIIVAVIDTGVTSVNQTLTTKLWTGAGFTNVSMPFAKSPDLSGARIVHPLDLVFSTNNNVLDMDGHSTHVSSTIAEDTNNFIGMAGIAFNVQIMPVKVCLGYWEDMIVRGQQGTPGFSSNTEGFCTDSAIVQGIHAAADNGAKVINISLGGDEPSPADQDAINYAVGKGAFVAIAMGNDFANGNPISYPAFYAAGTDGAMSVAAVTATSAHAPYSNTGTYCEISAPGGDALSDANSSLVWQVGLDFTQFDPTSVTQPRFDQYALIGMAGTSMATPHVSGVAALIFSQYKNITPAAVEALIKSTAQDLGATGRDDTFGYGLVQARAALFGKGIAK